MFYKKAGMTGSAIYMDITTSSFFENCIFKGNVLDTDSENERVGGACINSQGALNSMEIKSSEFKDNQALYYGNCIVFSGETIEISVSNFSNNTNVKSLLYIYNIINLGVGGVLFSTGKRSIIFQCIFLQNENKMGGVFSFSLNLQTLENVILIQESQFIQNQAEQFGGIVYFPPGFIIFNCTIFKNLFKENYAKQSNFFLKIF